MQNGQDDIPQKLLEAGLIDESAHLKALQQQKNVGGSVMANLVKVGAITEEALLEILSRYYSAPAADLKNFEPDPALVRLIPGDVATKLQALPLLRSGRRLAIAMTNPTNLFA